MPVLSETDAMRAAFVGFPLVLNECPDVWVLKA